MHEEADDARRRGILIPVLIEKVVPPIGFRSIQAVDLTDWNATEPAQALCSVTAVIAALVGSPRKVAVSVENRDSNSKVNYDALNIASIHTSIASVPVNKTKSKTTNKLLMTLGRVVLWALYVIDVVFLLSAVVNFIFIFNPPSHQHPSDAYIVISGIIAACFFICITIFLRKRMSRARLG